jgi:hypothetical protein
MSPEISRAARGGAGQFPFEEERSRLRVFLCSLSEDG